MPEKFEKCVKNGGQVRTVQPNKEVNIPVCFPKGGGKSVAGEARKKAEDRLKRK